jgi:hypothetical protein
MHKEMQVQSILSLNILDRILFVLAYDIWLCCALFHHHDTAAQ